MPLARTMIWRSTGVRYGYGSPPGSEQSRSGAVAWHADGRHPGAVSTGQAIEPGPSEADLMRLRPAAEHAVAPHGTSRSLST